MLTRKSGILALITGALVLGACENKAPVVNVTTPTPATSVKIAPNPVPQLKKGQTVQLVAVVQNNSNQSVTWSTSNNTVASVSTSGLVTANAPGAASIKAVSAADATASDAVAISVADTTGGTTPPPPGQPSISIGSITAGGTFFPVNPGAVAGVIDVTMNVDIPTGVTASGVQVQVINGAGVAKTVCNQTFSGTGAGDATVEGGQAPQTIICSFNTAGLTAGVPNFPNGTYTIKGQVLGATGAPIASATSQALVFANADVINAVLTASKGPASDKNSLSWVGGDLTLTLTPAIYTGAANNVSSVTVTLNNSTNAAMEGAGTPGSCVSTGRGPNGSPAAAGCAIIGATKTVTTTTNGAYVVTFPASSNFAAGTGSGNIEDPAMAFTITGLTTAGQNFGGGVTVIYNGNVISNSVNGSFPGTTNLVRVDNLAPRVTLLDITPATLGCAPNAACYVNGAFTFTADGGSTLATTLDYGVDKQTTTFAAGPTSASLTSVTNGGQLAETAVANTDILQAITTDVLLNSRTVYASTTAGTPVTSSTAATIQKFGVDLTPPTMTTSGNGKGVATAAAPGASNTFTFTGSDAGVGPSAIKQFNVKVEQITSAGTKCLTPAGALFAGTGSCTTAAAGVTNVAAAGTPAATSVVVPDASAYYRITVTVQDYAGNVSTPSQQVQLRDFVTPTVGGMATPSSIQGNTTVSFSAPMSDDLDLGDVTPTVGYTTGFAVYLAQPPRTIGSYGFDVFSTSDAGVFSVNNFVRSIETTAANAPSGVISLANLVQADVRDVAGVQLLQACPGAAAGDGAFTQNCFQRQATITAAVAFGMSNAPETSWAAAGRPFGTGVNNQGTFYAQTTSTGAVPPANTNVCSDNDGVGGNGAAAGCAVVTATTIHLWAQAQGPSQTFAAPFATLSFYATDPVTGRSFWVCSAGAPVGVDNTVNNTRTWTYDCTWNSQATTAPNAAGVYQLFALGVDNTGRGLMSQNRQVTLTAD